MAAISLSVLKIDEQSLPDAPRTIDIEAQEIRYVLGHVKESAYDEAESEVIYYNNQAAKLVSLLVTETPFEVADDMDDAGTPVTLITAERIEGGSKISKPMVLNANKLTYGVALSPKDELSLSVIVYSALSGGTFQPADVITGDVSLATAMVVSVFNVTTTGVLVVHPLNGTITSADSVSAGAVSADVDSYTAAPQKYFQYDNGFATSAKLKDIVAMLGGGNSDSITAVDVDAGSFTIAGNHTTEYFTDSPFFVDGSTGNDGLYSVVLSKRVSTNTVIFVKQTIPSSTADGTIKQ